MDDEHLSTPNQDTPGAPELGKGVKPPSAPLVEDKQTGPVFRAEPTMPTEKSVPVPVQSSSVAFDDDDEPEAPPALDEHQARIEYLQSLRQDKTKKKKGGRNVGKTLLAAALILVALGAMGGAGYFVYKGANPPKKSLTDTNSSANNTNTKQQNQQQPTDGEQANAVDTKQYNSTTFNLSLSYPSDWTPEELADKLTITSPVVSLTDANGQAANGRIVFAVRPKQAKPAEFTGGSVVAVLDSDKVSYTHPSASQRASTYISYLQYAATTTKGGLDGVYITGNYGYKYKQTVQLSEIANIDPLIDVIFVSCPDETCAATGQKPLTLSSSAWKADTTNRPMVEDMLKSLTL